MERITPRIPQVDWSTGFERHWNGGNPAVTHAFNALSFLFPQAERLFINVAREVASGTDLSGRPELMRAVNGFITQEAIHTRQHTQYNEILRSQGFENVVHDFIERLQESGYRHGTPLTRLAVVCAYEHYTAILGHYLLHHPQAVAGAPSHLALIWGWHAAEETEHKAVCFDLYRAAGGGWLRRVAVFLAVSVNFQIMFARLYIDMLRRDGCFRRGRILSTLRQAGRFFWGGEGIGWALLRHGFRYLAPGFHPWHQDDRQPLARWLAQHKAFLTEVPATASPAEGR